MSTSDNAERALAVLARIATEFSALNVNLPEFLTRVLGVLGEDLGYDHCLVALVDERGAGRLIVRAATGLASPLLGMALPRGVHENVIATGQPALIPDLPADAQHSDFDVRSAVYAPVVVHGRPIGVLGAFRPARDAFTAQDLNLMVVVARYFSGAIQLASLQRQPSAAAATDALTDLPSEVLFREALELEIRRGQRYGQPLAVLCLDVDNLTRIREEQGDTHGHAVLRALGKSLRAMFRESDVIARAPDGFLLLLPHTPKRAAVSVAERIRQRTRNIGAGTGAPITVSVGVAEMPQDSASGDGVLAAGRDALDRAKQRGGDRVEAAGPAS